MHEGDVTHDEVNAAIAAAAKTIIFGRQNRLRDGVLLPDDKLPRFHAGHDTVKFFYSAVRQLPEYFLDALLSCNISVTLVTGQGLLVFRDVRHHQAIHAGRTRRTIYLPQKILDVAAANGYDYWSITQVLIIEGWKLLDYVLLLRLVIASRQYMLDHTVTVLGWNTVRRMVQRHNRHRSTFESQELADKRDKWGLDLPISELEAFTAEYESKLLAAIQHGGDERFDTETSQPFRDMPPEDVARSLYNDHVEDVWGARKAEELSVEMEFPDFFLLDRDIVHPAAREQAEVTGQDVTPQDIGEARHDFGDSLRFGIGPELATERFVQQGLRFAPDGLRGLVAEMAAGFLRDGLLNRLLWDKTLDGLLCHVARADKVAIERDEGDSGVAKAEDVVRNYLDRGLDLMRLAELVRFHDAVNAGRQKLELEHIDILRELMVEIVESKARAGDMRRQMILLLTDVKKLFEELKGLLVGEAKRLLGAHVQREHVEASHQVLGWIDEAMERTMVQLTLNLELTCPPGMFPFPELGFGTHKGVSMSRKRYTAEQIIGHLRQAEIRTSEGKTVAEAVHELGISEQTYYRWRKQYGGMEVSQARRLKELEQENGRLKRLVADQALDLSIHKEVSRGNF